VKRLAIYLGVLFTARAACAYVAIVNKADHTEIHVVPTPGAVVIDGARDDWDLSGANLMCLDESNPKAYTVHGAMMYDADFLYISAHVQDPTPMVNNYTFGGEVNMAWNADAIQIFLLSNPDIHSTVTTQGGAKMSAEDQKFVNMFWMWYSTQDQAAGYFSFYTLGFQNPTLNPPGVVGAYAKDADGQGYTLEYRVPWSVLRAPRPLTAGDRIQIMWQMHWGNAQGMAVRCGFTDVRNPAGGDLGYMGPVSWGTAVFEKTGQLKLPERNVLGRAEGHIPIAFTLEKAGKVSLAVCTAEGQIIRTCLGAQPYPAGDQVYLWDGLDDYGHAVAAGAYEVKMLTHEGVVQNYVCDIGVSGTPPYQTEDGSGGWAGDYNMPQTMAIADDAVILGTASAEAMMASIRTDLDGRKRYGTMANGKAVAVHKGFAYFLSRGGAKITKCNLENGLLTPFSGGRPDATVTTQRADESGENWGSRSWQLYGLTVLGDRLIVSSLTDNRLHLLDLASGEPCGDVPLARPFGLAVAPDGTLYAVSSNTVGRYDLKAEAFTPLLGDLDEPRHLACDAAGNLYVGLQGQTMQVWKLAPDGKVLLKYGTPGGRPALGAFDPDGMLNPYGIAVDRNDRLWVAEADPYPKRYSVWNPDGTLWREFFGSVDYSTRAIVDPDRPEHVYMQSVRYLVDYDTGTWKVDATVLRAREDGGIKFGGQPNHAGGVFARVQGRVFFWTQNSTPGFGPSTLYEQVDDRFVPRLSIEGRKWWLDGNNDGAVQAWEIHYAALPGYYFGLPMDTNLNFYAHRGVGWANQGGAKTTQPYSITRWDFLGFNEQGGLTYADPTTLTVLATDPEGGAVSGVAPSEDGGYYAVVSGGSLARGQRHQGSGHRVVKFSATGEKLWAYHNAHCAFAWTSDVYTPGYLVGLCGTPGGLRELVAFNGYYGQYFLLDAQEGLFVDALGQDQRSIYTMNAGMVLTENFNGTLFRHPKSGKYYYLGGDCDQRVWELGGLDTIKRKTVKLTVSPEQATQAGASARHNLLAQQSAAGKKTAKLPRLANAAADGTFDEWGATQPLAIALEGARTAYAQIGYDAANLYVRFQVSDESPFINTPTDPRLLFKSGDAVEIGIATHLGARATHAQNRQRMEVGDTRILIARTAAGKLMATRYRYVTADSEKPNAFSVETPSSGKDTLDDVASWNDLPVHVTVEKDGYVVEAAIPWAELGVTPASGLSLLGDIGVIYGNEGGTRNAIRYLWSDKSPEVSINNDIPSEIRIHPNAWGTWMLE